MTVMGPIWCESERMDQPRPLDLTFMLRKLTSKNVWEILLYLQMALDNPPPTRTDTSITTNSNSTTTIMTITKTITGICHLFGLVVVVTLVMVLLGVELL